MAVSEFQPDILLEPRRAKLVDDKAASLITDREFTRAWTNLPNAFLDEARDILLARRSETDPYADLKKYTGKWRIAWVSIKRSPKDGDGQIFETLRYGLATAVDWTEARLLTSVYAKGNAQSANSVANTTSIDPERYLVVRFPNIDPRSIAAIQGVAPFSSTALTTFTVETQAFSGTWYVVFSSSGRDEDDGAAWIDLILARDQFTTYGVESQGGSREDAVYRLYNVPKTLVQTILDAWRTAGASTKGYSARESYDSQKHTSTLVLSKRGLTGVTILNEITENNQEHTDTTDYYFGVVDSTDYDLTVANYPNYNAVGYEHTKRVSENGDGTVDITITERDSKKQDTGDYSFTTSTGVVTKRTILHGSAADVTALRLALTAATDNDFNVDDMPDGTKRINVVSKTIPAVSILDEITENDQSFTERTDFYFSVQDGPQYDLNAGNVPNYNQVGYQHSKRVKDNGNGTVNIAIVERASKKQDTGDYSFLNSTGTVTKRTILRGDAATATALLGALTADTDNSADVEDMPDGTKRINITSKVIPSVTMLAEVTENDQQFNEQTDFYFSVKDDATYDLNASNVPNYNQPGYQHGKRVRDNGNGTVDIAIVERESKKQDTGAYSFATSTGTVTKRTILHGTSADVTALRLGLTAATDNDFNVDDLPDGTKRINVTSKTIPAVSILDEITENDQEFIERTDFYFSVVDGPQYDLNATNVPNYNQVGYRHSKRVSDNGNGTVDLAIVERASKKQDTGIYSFTTARGTVTKRTVNNGTDADITAMRALLTPATDNDLSVAVMPDGTKTISMVARTTGVGTTSSFYSSYSFDVYQQSTQDGLWYQYLIYVSYHASTLGAQTFVRTAGGAGTVIVPAVSGHATGLRRIPPLLIEATRVEMNTTGQVTPP